MWTALTSKFQSLNLYSNLLTSLFLTMSCFCPLHLSVCIQKALTFPSTPKPRKGQHYKYINQASAYPISIINLSQADLMRDPYKKHRSRIGGNLPVCSGVAASAGNSIELSTAFPYASLDGHPSPSSSCSSKSSQILLLIPNHTRRSIHTQIFILFSNALPPAAVLSLPQTH